MQMSTASPTAVGATMAAVSIKPPGATAVATAAGSSTPDALADHPAKAKHHELHNTLHHKHGARYERIAVMFDIYPEKTTADLHVLEAAIRRIELPGVHWAERFQHEEIGYGIR